ncbi:MAG: glycosyltransferase [Anaerolineales bacterium]|nr:glycosyltransferase [Anaerolineales bacterium]
MEQPLFSIIIPTCDRPDPLISCLQAISRLEYPHDQFEVIVVDDGSTHPLAPIVARYHSKLDITLLTQENFGPAAARNTGAEIARGRYLAFTDDDCQPDALWLDAMARRFNEMPEVLIGGQTINALSGNLYLTASQLLIDYLYAHYTINGKQPRFFTSNNMALPAIQFKQLGGFDLKFRRAGGEDREFCDRWHYNNYRMIYDPEVVVYHAHLLTFRTYWKQHRNYGRGAFVFQQAHAQRDQDRIRLEPLSFYLRLISYPFIHSPNWRSPILSLLLVVSQMANAAGFFQERLRKSP